MSKPVISVIGLGLIGSSLARAFRKNRAAAKIIGYDADKKARQTVRRLGFVDKVFETADAAVKNADIVILCIPVGRMGAVAKAIKPHLKNGAILTDVGSTKMSVISAILPHVRKDIHFIPSHPIAGTENSGPESGFAELFERRLFVLTPLKKANQKAVKKLEQLWKSIGSRTMVIDAKVHDEVLAITSHLPHLIAFGLMQAIIDEKDERKDLILALGGGSFRDITRVAAADPVMWRDIFIHNDKALKKAYVFLEEGVREINRLIGVKTANPLRAKLKNIRSLRRDLPYLEHGNVPKSKRFTAKN